MTIYVDEFLFRGRAPDDAEPPAWHVVLGNKGVTVFNDPFRDMSTTMNSQQAESAGWSLPTIIADINTQLLKQCEVQAATIADLKTQLKALPASTTLQSEFVPPGK